MLLERINNDESSFSLVFSGKILVFLSTGCGMPTEDAYCYGHLVLFHLGLACIPVLHHDAQDDQQRCLQCQPRLLRLDIDVVTERMLHTDRERLITPLDTCSCPKWG